ncbi:MAG: hypothetical protein JRJ85_03645, partial [Deltaproteobacteria bacterium]|nr:hypothetical protein [Deltaproteobacteria bacterium]
MHDHHQVFTSGQLYVTDSIGDIAGGVIFSFILVYLANPFKTIAITSALLIVVALLILVTRRKYVLFLCTVLPVVIFCLFAMNSGFERRTLSRQYGDIMHYQESPYGRIVMSREGPQHTFWESGLPLYSDANILNAEEKIHYPLCQLDRVGNVLLISGGLGETMAEILKHRPARVDYVELDPHLTGVARQLGFIKPDPRLNIVNTDGRRYLRSATKSYDAIIIDLPDPDTFQINRFFTSEFFYLCKKNLTPGGVLSFGMTYSPNYISEVRKKKLSVIYNTARAHFRNIMILPGGEAYFLCRNGELREDIPLRLEEKSVKTAYIEGFFYGNVTEERIANIRNNLDTGEFINTDFEPRIMNIIFQEWFTKHGASPRAFLLIFAALAVLYVFFMKKEEYVLFSTGLASMGIEMLVIFTFQVIYGYIYLKLGAVITAFLLGLLPGSVTGNYFQKKKRINLLFSDMILLGLLLVFFIWISFFRTELHSMFFLGYCFTYAFFCGFQFPLAASIIGEDRSPAAGCLAADLSGAAVGTLATGTLLIPMWGIQAAIFFLIMVKISSNIMIFATKKSKF